MSNYKDNRAVSEDFISDLKNSKKLAVFTDFVRNLNDELQMCFRGNDSQEKVIVYKNNHKVWEIVKYTGQHKYKVGISFKHARYCDDLETILEKFVELGFRRKTLSQIIDNGYLYTDYQTSFSEEFVAKTYSLIRQLFDSYFNYEHRTNGIHKEKDWLKTKNNKEIDSDVEVLYTDKKFLVEKIKQQELFYNVFNDIQGCFAYDLEFSQKYPSKDYKKQNNVNSNQPDMLAIKANEDKVDMVFIEVKSLKSACTGDSGVIKHLRGMVNYIDEIIVESKDKKYKVLENRKTEACEIIKAYKELGLRACDKEITVDDFDRVEIMLVFTDTGVDSVYKYDIKANMEKDISAVEWINDIRNKNSVKKEIKNYQNVKFSFKTYIDGQLNDVVL